MGKFRSRDISQVDSISYIFLSLVHINFPFIYIDRAKWLIAVIILSTLRRIVGGAQIELATAQQRQPDANKAKWQIEVENPRELVQKLRA